jgi:hypothetical protein
MNLMKWLIRVGDIMLLCALTIVLPFIWVHVHEIYLRLFYIALILLLTKWSWCGSGGFIAWHKK